MLDQLVFLSLAGGFGFVIGFFLARLGTWIRLARVDNDIRALSNELTTHRDFGAQTITVEWVQLQLDLLVRRNFRH